MIDRLIYPQLRRAACLLTICGLAAGSVAPVRAADDAPVNPSQARMKADVSFLAADAQGGRGPGTSGIEAAADHIAAGYAAAGLKPAPGAEGYFQPFTIRGDGKLVGESSLAFKGPNGRAIKFGPDDFSPLAIGSGGKLDGTPIVFAGYGITAKDSAKGLDYDDYAGLDVKGKAVLVIRREPQMNDPKSLFDGKAPSTYATFTHKATNAYQHGASAVLFVNDLGGLQGDDDKILKFPDAGSAQNSPIPFVMITRKLADELLDADRLPLLAATEQAIDGDLKPRSQPLEGWTVTATIGIERPGLPTKNVIGVLEGVGPHSDETVVVGGHYDHLGNGGLMSGSLAFFSKDIHNGADDNASGTAMVMELARRLAQRKDPLPRRVVFMAFSGEEKGLLGSRYYVEHPLFPLDKTVMMVNFDMVGRLNDKSDLTMVGLGSTPGLEQLVESLGTAAGFRVKKVRGVSDGFGGSDHESFYIKKVPVLFPFTGLHSDYHRPSDDTERINFPGMLRIADYGELLLLDIAQRPTRPVFVAEAPKNPHAAGLPTGSGEAPAGDPNRMGGGAYLGSVPNYGDEDVVGVKLDDVRANSPAEKGGMRGGDIIVGFAGKPISSLQDYSDTLNRCKPGDAVDVVVKRGGKDVLLKITLGSRPGR